MAFKNSGSFSMLFLAIFTILLVSQNANAQLPDAINPFCKTATNKQLCTRTVNGATNLHDATVKAINVAIDVAKKIQTLTPLVVQASANLDAEIKAQLIDDCTESFSDTIEDLGLSIDMLKEGDMGGVGTRLSAAFDSNCADSLKEQGVHVPALDKLNGHFAKIMDNALAVAFQN